MTEAEEGLTEGWPPRNGDVWDRKGHKYHYIGDRGSEHLMPGSGRVYEYISLEHLKSGNPVLVYREGWEVTRKAVQYSYVNDPYCYHKAEDGLWYCTSHQSWSSTGFPEKFLTDNGFRKHYAAGMRK